MNDTQTRAKRTTRSGKEPGTFSADEQAAMRQAVKERKRAARLSPAEERAEGEREVLTKIADMPDADRVMAERLHALVTTVAPSLVPRTYYGMPAYAKDGKVLCFFKPASKFKERYASFGFEQTARLDDGAMWPTSFALLELTSADEERLGELVSKAVG
jgi:uncharacterized protein YdhG (YjbR/CyaY superfamily)